MVDDDRDVAAPLILFLESEGHTVQYAKDGAEGLKAVSKRFPDLIFLDIEMPKLAGPEMAFQLLIEDSGREYIPVVILSGVPNIHEVAGKIGTPYFMRKPFNLNSLDQLFKKALTEKIAPRPSFEKRKVG